MIRTHRRRHLSFFVVLAVLVPVVFTWSITRRQVVPFAENEKSATRLIAKLDPWQKKAATGEILESDTGRFLQIVLNPDSRIADPLVYISSQAPNSQALPNDARLLGIPGTLITFPDLSSGYLIVYSLAHEQVIDFVPFEVKQL